MIYLVYDREKHKDIVRLEDLDLCQRLCEVLNAIHLEKLAKNNIIVMIPYKRFVIIKEGGGKTPMNDLMDEIKKNGFLKKDKLKINEYIFN